MRAVQVPDFGGPEVLEVVDLPAPEVRPGEVRIEMAVADVMFLDARLRGGWGREHFALPLPYVPGGGVGGTVGEVGAGVDRGWLGRRVIAQTAASGPGGLPIGGYADLVTARADALVAVPDDLDLLDATSVVHDGRTALAVLAAAEVRPGETVLVTAAAGGLGVLLTQLARAAGAQVVAAAGGPAKGAFAEGFGAERSVDYAEPGWADGVGRVDVVLDGAGGEIGGAASRLLRTGGRFVGYGAAAGTFAAPAPAAGVRLTTLMDLVGSATVDWQALAEEAVGRVAAGGLRTHVGHTFALTDAAAAHRVIEDRSALGRTLLVR